MDEYNMGSLGDAMKRIKNAEKLNQVKQVSMTSCATIVSERDGVFESDKEGVLYTVRHESKFTRFLFNDFPFICQHSEPIKEEVFSQTPTKCKRIDTCLAKYEVTNVGGPNCIALCIEYRNDAIADFYFEVLLPLTHSSLIELITMSKKEINVFLSLLN
jgi:hypothetical protein